MNPVLRNILAIFAGLVGGSIVNMAIVSISGTLIPPPAGVDVTTVEGLKAGIHLFQPKHYILPFLAHALGTLTGAFLAVKIGASNKLTLALIIGVFFLMGGIMMVYQLPAPMWYNVLDLVVAYIPMAILGHMLAIGKNKGNLV